MKQTFASSRSALINNNFRNSYMHMRATVCPIRIYTVLRSSVRSPRDRLLLPIRFTQEGDPICKRESKN